jgi:opacity protein-like surface antigen
MTLSRSLRNICLYMASVALLLPLNAMADSRPASSWRNTLTAVYAWQGESDLDGGNNFRVDRGFVQFKTSMRLGPRLFGGFSIGYGEDRYRFNTTAGSFAPWQDIRTLQFGLPLRYLVNEKWVLFGLPVLRYEAEDGASLGDGREYGVIAGATYRFSDRLSIGPGLGGFKGIGNEDDVFPVLFINWRITDTLSLETGRGLAATRGPGLGLKWKPLDQWEFGLAARYEKNRFRLADTASNIGQDKSVPIVATASWQLKPQFRLSALAGIEASGALRVENSDGALIAEQSYSTAPIVGFVASLQF